MGVLLDSGNQPSLRSPMEHGLAEEHRWASAGEAISSINVNDKVIEEKEKELSQCIAHNYGRLKDVEKELQDVQLQLRLTSGPKKSALELIRRKIEAQNERVLAARRNFQAARKVAETAEEVLKGEEAAKDRLCQELNLLVQQSAHAQLERLQHLTQKIEALNQGFLPKTTSGDLAERRRDSGPERLPAGKSEDKMMQSSQNNKLEEQTDHSGTGEPRVQPGSVAAQKSLSHNSGDAAAPAPGSITPDTPEKDTKSEVPSLGQAAPSRTPSKSRHAGRSPPGEHKRTPPRPASKIGSQNRRPSVRHETADRSQAQGPFSGFE